MCMYSWTQFNMCLCIACIILGQFEAISDYICHFISSFIVMYVCILANVAVCSCVTYWEDFEAVSDCVCRFISSFMLWKAMWSYVFLTDSIRVSSCHTSDIELFVLVWQFVHNVHIFWNIKKLCVYLTRAFVSSLTWRSRPDSRGVRSERNIYRWEDPYIHSTVRTWRATRDPGRSEGSVP